MHKHPPSPVCWMCIMWLMQLPAQQLVICCCSSIKLSATGCPLHAIAGYSGYDSLLPLLLVVSAPPKAAACALWTADAKAQGAVIISSSNVNRSRFCGVTSLKMAAPS